MLKSSVMSDVAAFARSMAASLVVSASNTDER